jgi:hypothetical protein
MDIENLISYSGLVNLFLVFIAFWVAGRIISRNLFAIPIPAASRRPLQWMVLFAIAGFLTLPLIDLLRFLRSLLTILTPAIATTTGEVATLWGNVPWLVYDALMELTALFVYTFTLVTGRKWISEQAKVSKALRLSSFERGLILFAIAGLINFVVRNVLLSVTLSQGPQVSGQLGVGVAGFLAGWLLGILLLLGAAFLFSRKISGVE